MKLRPVFLILSIVEGLLFFLPIFVLGQQCIDINTAAEEELILIRHIGQSRAQQVILLRREKPFSSLDELSRVPGIGPARIADIKKQGLACINFIEKPVQGSQEQDPLGSSPEIILHYQQTHPVNEVLEINISACCFKEVFYDIKIAVEKEKNISLIYNRAEDKWQSSHYYVKNAFFGSSLQESFKLQIKEEGYIALGRADIVVRIRESNKSSYIEHRESINLIEAKKQPLLPDKEKELAHISRPLPDIRNRPGKTFLLALIIALISAVLIIIFKKKIYY